MKNRLPIKQIAALRASARKDEPEGDVISVNLSILSLGYFFHTPSLRGGTRSNLNHASNHVIKQTAALRSSVRSDVREWDV